MSPAELRTFARELAAVLPPAAPSHRQDLEKAQRLLAAAAQQLSSVGGVLRLIGSGKLTALEATDVALAAEHGAMDWAETLASEDERLGRVLASGALG